MFMLLLILHYKTLYLLPACQISLVTNLIIVADSLAMRRRQVCQYAWAERSGWTFGFSGELPIYLPRDSPGHCHKSTWVSNSSNSWSVAWGCFGERDCLGWEGEICDTIHHSICGRDHRTVTQVSSISDRLISWVQVLRSHTWKLDSMHCWLCHCWFL